MYAEPRPSFPGRLRILSFSSPKTRCSSSAISYVPSVRGAAQYMSTAGKANPFVNPPKGSKLYEFDVVPVAVEAELATLFVEATQL